MNVLEILPFFFRMTSDEEDEVSNEVFAMQEIFDTVEYKDNIFHVFVDIQKQVVCGKSKSTNQISIEFDCSNTYPMNPPKIYVRGDFITDKLSKHLEEHALNMSGSVMIFDLIQMTLMWLYEVGLDKQDLYTEMLKNDKTRCKLKCTPTNLCNICFCEKTEDILVCSANHFTCSDCINNYKFHNWMQRNSQQKWRSLLFGST